MERADDPSDVGSIARIVCVVPPLLVVGKANDVGGVGDGAVVVDVDDVDIVDVVVSAVMAIAVVVVVVVAAVVEALVVVVAGELAAVQLVTGRLEQRH
jgi:hypothetical protein